MPKKHCEKCVFSQSVTFKSKNRLVVSLKKSNALHEKVV